MSPPELLLTWYEQAERTLLLWRIGRRQSHRYLRSSHRQVEFRALGHGNGATVPYAMTSGQQTSLTIGRGHPIVVVCAVPNGCSAGRNIAFGARMFRLEYRTADEYWEGELRSAPK